MKLPPINDETRLSRQALYGSKQMSFLQEPDFNPKLPAKDTLAYHALSLMMHGNKISHRDFDDITCSWRLAAYIRILRELGWPVEGIDINDRPLNHQKIRHIKQYYLPKNIIKLAISMGVLNE